MSKTTLDTLDTLAAEHEALVHALFRLLADFGNTIEEKIPGSDLHMARVMLWSAVGRIAGEHSPEIAINVLKDIIEEIEAGVLEGKEPESEPPSAYN